MGMGYSWVHWFKSWVCYVIRLFCLLLLHFNFYCKLLWFFTLPSWPSWKFSSLFRLTHCSLAHFIVRSQNPYDSSPHDSHMNNFLDQNLAHNFWISDLSPLWNPNNITCSHSTTHHLILVHQTFSIINHW